MEKTEIKWDELGFSYIKTDYRYRAYYKDGKWEEGKLYEDNMLNISEASTALHYGQECFEGLKAFRTKDGGIQIFRPDQNAKRMNSSARKLLMPEVPEEMFINACVEVVKANERFIPPYGTGGALYIRPFLIGTGDNIGVGPAPEYLFSVFCVPVGAYFKGGMSPVNFKIADCDRAAPRGTGKQKVGGNYAASILAHEQAKAEGYADCVYLDPATHTKIEEVGSANFIGITKDNKLVTPLSDSILPSITKYSLLELARDYLHMEVIEGDVYIDDIDQFAEVGACGTAAVISPVGGIFYKGKLHVFYSETEVGPVLKKLYDLLVGIQLGDIEGPKGWIYKVK
ncbi:branched-chain amino acid aminotransferase [Clostridium sp. MSJ-8]|uniref:branched-chain amino acid aminotransferase n=1 Tax=Clostridium sp. MSJ-8 TaxID=2841510 RepID=UPI001C0EAEFC|nr:branched-chain amino acid aminotransferase [Clostridium sp. MSJ-8]MBU5487668.1 branched-chain amino acid aminotransferase [Clostridium sp. MSJ-8]